LDWLGQIASPRPIEALMNKANPKPSAAAIRSDDACREALSSAGSVEITSGGGAWTESLVISAHWLPSHQR
jgi:hypothetical protein